MPTDLPEFIVTADYAPLIRRQDFSRSMLARENPFSLPIVAETELVITLDGHFSYYLSGPLLADTVAKVENRTRRKSREC